MLETERRSTAPAAAIARACRLVMTAERLPSLAELAAASGMSRFHFQRVFKATTGVTPKAYVAAERRRRLQAELESGARVTDAIYAAGFNSSSRFYADAPDALGMTPKQFRAGGREATIRFAVGQCSLGAILVAASVRGVCAISLGDDPDALARELQDRFPRARIDGGGPEFDRWVATVVGFVDAPRIGCDLPLDIRGTAFEQRVWAALRAVPPGATATYTEIARRIGAPRATRAVARACAANPLAVAIPCHRIVRADGSLSGYRWGVERKRALLERERE
jgi:AraC family transcriptional regulator of adaptative response/methylated-DNA-[protein]-cysteine methyltransferase